MWFQRLLQTVYYTRALDEEQEDSLSRRFEWKRVRIRSPWVKHVLVAFVGYLIVLISLSYSHSNGSPSSFRASVNATFPLTGDQHALMQQMMKWAKESASIDSFTSMSLSEKQCGVTAVHFRKYTKMTVCSIKHQWQAVFNPEYRCIRGESELTEGIVSLTETSLICQPDALPIKTARCHRMQASFTDSTGTTQTIQLQGTEAYCFQRFANLLNGEFPCKYEKYKLQHTMVPRSIS